MSGGLRAANWTLSQRSCTALSTWLLTQGKGVRSCGPELYSMLSGNGLGSPGVLDGAAAALWCTGEDNIVQ